MALEVITRRDLPPAAEEEITQFLDTQNTGHPFQFPRWGGPGGHCVVLREAGRVRWFASVGMHRPLGRVLPNAFAATVNRGPVCDDLSLWQCGLNQLVQYMADAGSIYFDVAPDRLQVAGEGSAREFGQDWIALGEARVSLRLDLQKSDDQIMAGLRKTTRYEIRRGERTQAVVELAKTAPDIDGFLAMYRHMAGRKGFAADSPEHLRTIIGWLLEQPSRGALLLARHRGVAVGGAVIARCGKRCWYIWGANDRHEEFSAGHLVQWHALLWAKEHGCTEYDFGGYTPGATSGPAFFKEGFGGEVVHFVPAHRRVLRPGYYRLIRWRDSLL